MEVHHHTVEPKSKGSSASNMGLALQATLHCLLGCGLGEILGMIVSTALSFSNTESILISVIFGFIGGLILGVIPLTNHGFTLNNALKTVIVGEGLSIVVMEAFEVLTVITIPGVMNAHLTDAIFWIGMLAALIVGFIAAFPINYLMIKRGVKHKH